MDYIAPIKEIMELLSKEFLLFIVLPTVETFLFNAFSMIKASKYDGYTIANGEFLKNLREKLPKPEEKNNYKGKFKEKVDKLIEYCDPKDLDCLYRNLSTVKIGNNPFLFIVMISGAYVPIMNVMGYSSEKSFTHELFHLASTYYDKTTKIELSGFSQRKGLARIGSGLTEGYTELLASRVENREVHSYQSESKLANMIEYFFDDPKEMQSLYMNHDLPGLANQMAKYTSREEFLNMIYNIEFSRGPVLPVPPITMILAQVKLYQWFSTSCKDEKKLAEFKDLACKNKIVELIIKRKEIKLCKGSSSTKLNMNELELEKLKQK